MFSKKLTIPSPFAIAVILTIITLAMALLFTQPTGSQSHIIQLFGYWEKGFWELLEFTGQMMLILLLGHTLALSPPVSRLIERLIGYCNSTTTAVVVVSFSTLLISFINWGMCLVFGAILARKIGEHASRNNISINYPLIGASAYTGMMVWHGGLSGSAPLSVAQNNHFLQSVIGRIDVSETLFSGMNILASLIMLFAVPALAYLLSKVFRQRDYISGPGYINDFVVRNYDVSNTSFLDRSVILTKITGAIICLLCLRSFVLSSSGLSFLNLNYINFLLFGLCLLSHQSFFTFQKAAEEAIGGVTGILIQFPLYAGIMGIMKYSGLVTLMADYFVSASTSQSLPIVTFISAAVINIFVPSGGGQWALQGPILVEAAIALKVPIPKIVMALAYGDEITNMLQPFWALPLLGITQLKVRQILPYSLLFMLLGIIVYGVVLWFA